MSVPHTLLGLLESGPSHGYTLKQEFDRRFGAGRPLRYGQVYATLARLQRDGWAREVAVEAGGGPDRRLYAVTDAGVAEFDHWLTTPAPATGYADGLLFTKTVLALLTGRPAAEVLDAQRRVHVSRMREVRAASRNADAVARLAADFEIDHLDADLRWMERAIARLDAARDLLTTSETT